MAVNMLQYPAHSEVPSRLQGYESSSATVGQKVEKREEEEKKKNSKEFTVRQ